MCRVRCLRWLLLQVGIDIGFHVQSFLSEADMGVRMTGGNVAVMGDMVRRRKEWRDAMCAASVLYDNTYQSAVRWNDGLANYCRG